ncbi:MAG: hypothetical protein ABIE03_07325 [Patescibacteria group bacterium]|nr:hypothetical protein [Patescibacteria group bacterium]
MKIYNKITENKYFDLYFDAAKDLGIDFTYLITDKPVGYFHRGNKKLYINKNIIGLNNAASSLYANMKFIGSQILSRAGYPVPRGVLIKKDAKDSIILSKLKELQPPLVVKPQCGFGGTGVSVKLEDTSKVLEAVRTAENYDNQIIIEEYCPGKDYRIIVYKDKIIDVIERTPAFVAGNGSSTIKMLIEAKNNIRQKVNLQKIPFDKTLTEFLQENGLDLSSVPEKGATILLRKNCNMNTGGETTRMDTASIHLDNMALFTSVVSTLGLTFAGVDFITPDLNKSYKTSRSIINEVNRAPQLGANYYADLKMDNFVCKEVFKYYFELENE